MLFASGDKKVSSDTKKVLDTTGKVSINNKKELLD